MHLPNGACVPCIDNEPDREAAKFGCALPAAWLDHLRIRSAALLAVFADMNMDAGSKLKLIIGAAPVSSTPVYTGSIAEITAKVCTMSMSKISGWNSSVSSNQAVMWKYACMYWFRILKISRHISALNPSATHFLKNNDKNYIYCHADTVWSFYEFVTVVPSQNALYSIEWRLMRCYSISNLWSFGTSNLCNGSDELTCFTAIAEPTHHLPGRHKGPNGV